MQEGTYEIQVTVKDSFSTTTGESTTASYTAQTRVVGTSAVISPTSNPLVALYSAPPSSGSFDVRPVRSTGPESVLDQHFRGAHRRRGEHEFHS